MSCIPASRFIGNDAEWQGNSSDPDLRDACLRMTVDEAITWQSILLTAARYLEWGSGGSTVVAAWQSLRSDAPGITVDAIESSESYIRTLRERHPVLTRAEEAWRLRIHSIHIGPTVEWGMPAGWDRHKWGVKQQLARRYVEAVGTNRCCFDLVLVDGRFRVACALRERCWSPTCALHPSLVPNG
jgi:protein O-GlcNAc transferase